MGREGARTEIIDHAASGRARPNADDAIDSKSLKRALGEDFAERRAQARERLDAVDPHKRPGGIEADPKRHKWFEAVYALAKDDPAGVPWADLQPRPLLEDWLAARSIAGLRALEVGCGLGDNAEALARAGAHVTAFDLVERAVQWARQRFPQSAVDYRVADLFNAPQDWRGAFDFVHELYTLQALPETLLSDAARALASFVAPGGTLLVISRARDNGEDLGGPPWPLTRTTIESFAVDGLRLISLEDIPASGGLDHAAFGRNRPNADDVIDSKSLERALCEKPASTFSQRALARHWRAEFRRDEAGA